LGFFFVKYPIAPLLIDEELLTPFSLLPIADHSGMIPAIGFKIFPTPLPRPVQAGPDSCDNSDTILAALFRRFAIVLSP
jgi:hypothetical protein